MTTNTIIEQIKAMSCEERHYLLDLLNEKESILVEPKIKPTHAKHWHDCYTNLHPPNPYGLKKYQKPICIHIDLVKPYYSCITCTDTIKNSI